MQNPDMKIAEKETKCSRSKTSIREREGMFFMQSFGFFGYMNSAGQLSRGLTFVLMCIELCVPRGEST